MKRAKKHLILLIAVFCIAGAFYLILQNLFLNPYIPRGYTDCEEHREEIPWMDWTDFCWYQYPPDDDIKLPDTYERVTEKDVHIIKGYFDNTRMCLEDANRLDEYKFDQASINKGDTWLLFTNEGKPRGNGVYGKYDIYTLYFFDKEASRLYYLNQNF